MADITADDVLRAIQEYDLLGQSGFLAKYRFGPARSYRLSSGGRLYDSKAILGVAHGLATGTFWTASDFTGGQASVGRVLTRLGFVVTVDGQPSEPGSVDEWLDALRGLRVAVYNGERAPYQYVVLLWAIARAQSHEDRMMTLADARNELATLLAPFSLGSSRPDPRDPWFALDNSPWWHLDTQTDLTKADIDMNTVVLPEWDQRGGLAVEAYERIAVDAAFTTHAIDTITQIIGHHPAYPDLLTKLKLTVENSVGSGIVIQRPVERRIASKFSVGNTPDETRERQRRESELQNAYHKYLISIGRNVCRYSIFLKETPASILWTDLHDITDDELIEVKASSDRETVRLALGQLLDYARYVPHATKAVLFPIRPIDDLIGLLVAHGISVIWQTSDRVFDRINAST